MLKSKSNYAFIAIVVLLSLSIFFGIAFSFAWFTDKSDAEASIKFGTIQITTNKDNWFSSEVDYYASIKPNDVILNEDIKFNLQEADGETSKSSPLYVRVKYAVSLNGATNSEVIKVYNYLKYRDLELSTSSDYTWSEKRGDYYYLLDAQGNPLVVENKRVQDYIFLTVENSRVSFDLEFDATLVNSDSIKHTIAIEAIQARNLVEENETVTLEAIETHLNAIKSIDNTGSYNVKFNLNGNETNPITVNYGESCTIPANIIAVMNDSNFDGFALWENGLTLIKEGANNHSSISLDGSLLLNITENITFYVKTTEIKYLVQFVNYDGTVLQTNYLKAGEIPQYIGQTPTKASTATKKYIFNGWDKSLAEISANTIFTAQFTEHNI